MEKNVASAKNLIGQSQKILVFTGAGISTESGIPDFRSPGGLWSKYDPDDFYFHKMISDEKAREKYWEMSSETYRIIKRAKPNKAHYAIKTLEDRGKLLSLVTQNIDGLHHKAGNSQDKIIEIHGTVFTVSCLDCGKKYDSDEIENRINNGVKIPYCDDCSGILKPDTISFGQSMPADKMSQAINHACHCDLCIILGSSLVVYPAASIPEYAIKNKAKLIIVNRDETPLDSYADIVIHDSVSEVMGQIVNTNR
ncbi:MAG: Sir2 family NAD-dependent protein deacetylase [Bacteroidia bacterium]|nr:Sir2 family NAD-dependent protein deacetylase [Bacteroidia bacterium]